MHKFHYLDNALTGDAVRAIQSLGVSDKRSLIHFHLSSLFNLPVLTKGTFVALRQLMDDTNNNLMALKSLGDGTDA